jgi:hypothetical protein
MIVETAEEIEKIGGTLKGLCGVLDLPVRTLAEWRKEGLKRAEAPSSSPSQKPSPPDVSLLVVPLVRAGLKTLVHRRHRTQGVTQFWARWEGQIPRAQFRVLSREVRDEVKRERRNQVQRYEFLHPDVAHSLDYTELPRSAPGAGKQYLAKIMDDCSRLTLKRAFTLVKGAGYGATFVHEHLVTHRKPLVLKFDLEFDVPQFIDLLLDHGVVPLPSPGGYPPFNGKTERSYRDVKDWLAEFGKNVYWTPEELEVELDLCFTQLDDVDARAVLGGRTARVAYEQTPRAAVDPKVFFKEALELYDRTMRLAKSKLLPRDVWRYAAKELLKTYGLVRYSRPCNV